MQPLYDEAIEIYDLMNYRTGSNLAAKFANFVEDIFQSHKTSKIESILDIGCGSGEPTIELSRRGYNVTGIDINCKAIEYARSKVIKADLPIRFICTNLEALDPKEKYDAVSIFFNTINLLGNQKKLLETFKKIYDLLPPGGILYFDTVNPITQILSPTSTRATLRNTSFGDIYTSMTLRINPVNLEMDSFAVVFANINNQLKMITHRDKLQGYTLNELKLLLKLAGYSNVIGYSDFNINNREPNRARILNVVSVK